MTPLERYHYLIRERNKKVEKGIKIKYYEELQEVGVVLPGLLLAPPQNELTSDTINQVRLLELKRTGSV